jgi:hypothetical protein
MAPADAQNGSKKSAPGAEFLDGLDGVLGTTRMESTAPGKEGRKQRPVCADDRDE